MPNSNARIDRLEESMLRAFNAIEALADKQEKLHDVVTLLVDAQTKTMEYLREVDKASRDRDRALDDRADKLVSAIGEFLRDRRN
jgi:hypothetical protein